MLVWCNCLLFVFVNCYFVVEVLQNVGDLCVSDMVVNQVIQFVVMQCNGGVCWQIFFVGNVNDWVGFIVVEVDQQMGCMFQCFILQGWIDVVFIVVRGIGVQVMMVCVVGNGQWVEECVFQQYVLGFVVNVGVFFVEDFFYCQCFVMVCNDQSVVVEFCFRVIEQDQGFFFFCYVYYDFVFNMVVVKGVYWLIQFKQYIVGYVNYCVDGVDFVVVQFFFYLQWCWCFDVDIFYYVFQIVWVSLWCVNLNWQYVVNCCGNWCDFWCVQWCFVQDSDIVCYVNDVQVVGVVWCDVDFDGVIVKFEIFVNIGVDGCICWQFDDIVMVVGNIQFGEGVQYFFRWFVVQFCGFDFEIVWQYGVDGGYCDFQFLMVVWCVVDDVQQVFVVDVDFGDVQFIGVWVLIVFYYFIDNDVVEVVGDWFNVIYFEVCYGDLIGKCFVVDCWVNLFV